MENSKEYFKYLLQKVAKLLNSIFPGIAILEVFFEQGFFSKIPETLYSFVLYLIWAIILSIPYHYINPSSVERFLKNLFKIYGEKEKIPKEKLIDIYEKQDEELNDLEHEFLFGFVLLKTIITIIIGKLIFYFNFFHDTLLDIPINILVLTVSLLATYFLSIPIGFIYAKYNLSKFKKHIHENF